MTLAARITAAARLQGSFTLRSGAVSDTYFDKYRFEADPALLGEVAQAVAALVPADTDALAGLELGGVPIATVVGQLTGLPVRFVRKEPKDYGTRQLAEGGPVAGLRLLIVEDVVTSGGAILDAVPALRALGAAVDQAVCVIDRQSGGAANLAAVGVSLRSVLRMSDLT
jgi:orotate phosphoribosyltransferase